MSYESVKKPKGIVLSNDINSSLGKLPPQAIDLEEVILAAALLERQGCVVALEKMSPDDFYSAAHKEIFSAIKELASDGNGVDMRTVTNQLRRTGKLELIGGAYYIADLTSKLSSSANIEYYCLVVKEKRIMRDIIQFASMLHCKAYEDTEDAFDLIGEISKFPGKILEGINAGNEKSISERVKDLGIEISKRTTDRPEISGIPSGYESLDNVTRGWQCSDLIILAARPSMGKTTLALNCARNAAVDFKVPVGMFSLEMSYRQLTDKIISMETEIGPRTLHDKVFSPVEWDQYLDKTKHLVNAHVWIDDSPAISITQLRISARRMVEKYGIKMIIVDYLQLMKGEDGVKTNREQEIASISGGLKRIAKELDIPIIAISQLSREVDKLPLPRIPNLSHLRESGAIEQDADIIIFLWRPEYYKIQGDDRGTYIHGLTKLIIAKFRNGPLAEPSVAMHGPTSKFRSVASPYMDNQKVEQKEKWVDVANKQPDTTSDDLPF